MHPDDLVVAEKTAKVLLKAGMYGKPGEKQPSVEAVMACLLYGLAEGKHMMAGARDFSPIAGRPAKKSEALMRDYIAAGGRIKWIERSDTRAAAEFSSDQVSPILVEWTMKTVERAGIKNALYKSYGRQMLSARCAAEGCRAVAPACTSGLMSVEEATDRAISNPEDAPPPAVQGDLLERAKDSARRGTEDFDHFWGSITEQDRESLTPYSEDLSQLLTEADAQATVKT